MNDDNTTEKLRKNTMRASSISALRKIRKLVNEYDQEEYNNKKHLKVILLILAIVFSCLVYYFFVHDRNYQYIKLSNNKTYNVSDTENEPPKTVYVIISASDKIVTFYN